MPMRRAGLAEEGDHRAGYDLTDFVPQHLHRAWSWQLLPATASQGKVTSQAWELSAKAEDMSGDWPTYDVAQDRSVCPSMARLGHGLGDRMVKARD